MYILDNQLRAVYRSKHALKNTPAAGKERKAHPLAFFHIAQGVQTVFNLEHSLPAVKLLYLTFADNFIRCINQHKSVVHKLSPILFYFKPP